MTRSSKDSAYLRVDVARQALEWVEDDHVTHDWPVSTAKNGLGELRGSEMTPRGWHLSLIHI